MFGGGGGVSDEAMRLLLHVVGCGVGQENEVQMYKILILIKNIKTC